MTARDTKPQPNIVTQGWVCALDATGGTLEWINALLEGHVFTREELEARRELLKRMQTQFTLRLAEATEAYERQQIAEARGE